MMQTAIFRSAGQCLHVAFLMELLPPAQESFMQKMIEDHMKSIGIWHSPSTGERTINFAGMTQLEIRGQCAMVRAAVNDHLPETLRGAIWARYAYQRRKAFGVRVVAEYAAPSLATTDELAYLALAWNVFGTANQREGLSVRKIADERGLDKSTLGRDLQRVRQAGQRLEGEAITVLGDLFTSTNLTESV